MRGLLRWTIICFLLLSEQTNAQWVQTNGLGNEAFAVSGNNLFSSGLSGDLYISKDNGTTWTTASNGLGTWRRDVRALAVIGSNLFAGTNGGGVFRSSDNGTNWTAVNSGLTRLVVCALATDGSNLFAGTAGGGSGIFLSTNNGSSWTNVSTGIPANSSILSFVINGNQVFAGTDRGVYLSSNNGALWTRVNSGLADTVIYTLEVIGSNVFAGTDHGVYLSINNGASWSQINNNLPSGVIFDLVACGGNLFAGTLNNGVFVTTNNGISWASVSTGTLTSANANQLAVLGSLLFVGAGYVWKRPLCEMLPGTPQLSGPGDGTTGLTVNPTFTWNGTCATTYTIQVSIDSGFSTFVVNKSGISTMSYNASTLLNNTKYFWRVNASNQYCTGAWSSIWAFSTIVAIPAVPVLSTPSNGAYGVSSNPQMVWNTAPRAVSYSLQMSTAVDFSTSIVNQTGISSTSFNSAGLVDSTRYFWRVNAANSGGTSSWSPTWSFVTTIISAPPVPVLISPINVATQITFNPTFCWNKAAGAESYTLQVSISPLVFDVGTLKFNYNGISSMSYTVGYNAKPPLALKNETYYWRVCATNGLGTSAWSPIWSFTTVDLATVLSSPVNGTTSVSVNPVISWKPTLGASSYVIMVSIDSNFSTPVVNRWNKSMDTSYSISGLSGVTKYFWKIMARCDSFVQYGGYSIDGAWSNVWNFTTAPSTATLPTSFSVSLSGGTIRNHSLLYSIPIQSNVFLAIYDIRGRLILNILSGQQSPGYYTVNLEKFHFSTGRYFLRFIAGNFKRVIPLFNN